MTQGSGQESEVLAPPSPWRAVLHGRLADEARDSISAIAEDLSAPSGPAAGLEGRFSRSLAFGRAGIALFYAYQATSEKGLRRQLAVERALRFLNESLIALSQGGMVPDLSRGVAGVGWVYEHLKHRVWKPEASDGDPCVDIDELLRSWCDSPGAGLDLMEGLAGVSLYAAERPNVPSARYLMARVVEVLDRSAVPVGSGRAWRAPGWIATLLSRHEGLGSADEMRSSLEAGVFKIGAAHGAAGILACLASALPQDVESSRVRQLAADVLAWIWKQRLPEPTPNTFPEFVGVWSPQVTTGWCNGDVGIAAALFTLANVLAWPDERSRALELARRVARLRLADVELFNQGNPTLCHGSAGRGHLFNRLYQSTGEEEFLKAALYWLEHALSLRRLGEGTGGFCVDEPRNGGRKNVTGFLMGAAGLGLALLAATVDQEPAWDRLLLASSAGSLTPASA